MAAHCWRVVTAPVSAQVMTTLSDDMRQASLSTCERGQHNAHAPELPAFPARRALLEEGGDPLHRVLGEAVERELRGEQLERGAEGDVARLLHRPLPEAQDRGALRGELVRERVDR